MLIILFSKQLIKMLLIEFWWWMQQNYKNYYLLEVKKVKIIRVRCWSLAISTHTESIFSCVRKINVYSMNSRHLLCSGGYFIVPFFCLLIATLALPFSFPFTYPSGDDISLNHKRLTQVWNRNILGGWEGMKNS